MTRPLPSAPVISPLKLIRDHRPLLYLHQKAFFVLSNLWHHFDLLGNDVAIYLKHQIKLKLKLVNDVFILLTHQIKVKIEAGLK